MKSLLIASTSTIHQSGYLDYLLKALQLHFKGIDEILFIPYARPEGIPHHEYTQRVSKAFNRIGIKVKGIEESKNPVEAITNAKGIFVGGGNTFVLVNQLYRHGILDALRKVVLSGTPYLGTSAGSNICGLTMSTTNDMPIVYPPSFKTLGFVPFNINPHYLDPNPNSKHMGETRETRIKEFHSYNTQPVIGLREGSWISVNNNTLILKGKLSARIFEYGKDPYEIETETDLGFLK